MKQRDHRGIPLIYTSYPAINPGEYRILSELTLPSSTTILLHLDSNTLKHKMCAFAHIDASR